MLRGGRGEEVRVWRGGGGECEGGDELRDFRRVLGGEGGEAAGDGNVAQGGGGIVEVEADELEFMEFEREGAAAGV